MNEQVQLPRPGLRGNARTCQQPAGNQSATPTPPFLPRETPHLGKLGNAADTGVFVVVGAGEGGFSAPHALQHKRLTVVIPVGSNPEINLHLRWGGGEGKSVRVDTNEPEGSHAAAQAREKRTRALRSSVSLL